MSIICLNTYRKKRLLDTTIEELDIKVRTYNILKKMRIKNVSEILKTENLIKDFAKQDRMVVKDISKIVNEFKLIEGA